MVLIHWNYVDLRRQKSVFVSGSSMVYLITGIFLIEIRKIMQDFLSTDVFMKHFYTPSIPCTL